MSFPQVLIPGNVSWKTQNYVMRDPDSNHHTAMDQCFKDMFKWLRQNKLKLYPDKAEVMLVGKTAACKGLDLLIH